MIVFTFMFILQMLVNLWKGLGLVFVTIDDNKPAGSISISIGQCTYRCQDQCFGIWNALCSTNIEPFSDTDQEPNAYMQLQHQHDYVESLV